MAHPAAPLLPEPLVVRGHLVTFDSGTVIEDGALYIDVNGVIQGVAPRASAPPAGFDKAAEVDTGGLVFPGLIDLHNHMAYNCLSLWVPPDRDTPWINRDQWPRDPNYKPDISLPANALCHADAKAVLKFVETKAVIGGVTAIQGSAKLSHPFEGFMVRNVEFETFQTGKKTVNQSVRAFTEADQFSSAEKDLAKGNAFLYHLCEGTDPKLLTTDYAGIQGSGSTRPPWAPRSFSSGPPPPSPARWCGRRSATCGCTARPPTSRPRRATGCASALAPTGRRQAPRACSVSSRSPTCISTRAS
jgi:hypothetical protein